MVFHLAPRLLALSFYLALTACGPAGAPPDVVKTQRDALGKARDVARDALKQDQESRVQVDEASK